MRLDCVVVMIMVSGVGSGGGRFAVGVGFGEGACVACWDCCHLSLFFDGLGCFVGWWTKYGIDCGKLRYDSDEMEMMLTENLLDKRTNVRSILQCRRILWRA